MAAPFVDLGGLGQRAVGRDVQEGVHALVDGGDPVQVRLGHLGRGDLPAASAADSSAAVMRVRSISPPPGSAAP